MSVDLSKLKPKVARMATELVTKAQSAGTPILITQGLRTIEEQNKLYALGRTVPNTKIVTNAKGGQSWHNWGCAFDICFLVGKAVSYQGNWEAIGKLGESIGLSWGGRWNNGGKTGFVDRPHFEFTAGYKLADFQQGKVDKSKFA